MTSQRMHFFGAAVLTTFLVLLTYPAVAGSRTSYASTSFGRNSVRMDCLPFGSCENSQLEYTTPTYAGCAVGSGTPPHCSGGTHVETLGENWYFTSQLFFWGPPYQAPAGIASTGMTLEAIRISPQVLELTGVIDAGVWDESVELDPGPVEVAVFRFSSSPSVFEGVEVTSVLELVSLGLIQTDDILFREVHTYDVDDEDYYWFGGSVDVTGVPTDEIVVFLAEADVSFTSSAVVPASSAWGIAVLIVCVLSAATWILRRRRT